MAELVMTVCKDGGSRTITVRSDAALDAIAFAVEREALEVSPFGGRVRVDQATVDELGAASELLKWGGWTTR